MSNADKNTNAVMATREYRELAEDFAALQKERDALKAQLDKVLEDMHNDGTSKKISEKWFGIDVTM